MSEPILNKVIDDLQPHPSHLTKILHNISTQTQRSWVKQYGRERVLDALTKYQDIAFVNINRDDRLGNSISAFLKKLNGIATPKRKKYEESAHYVPLP